MNNAVTANDKVYPLLMPHVEVADGRLWLGAAQLCELTCEEEAYCRLSNGNTPLHQIAGQCGDPVLSPQTKAFLLPLLKPLTRTTVQDKKRKVLVVSPTPQTGYLAAGGAMAQWADAELLHVICFSQTHDSVLPEIFPSADAVSAIRHDEAEICACLCSAQNHFLQYPAYSVRKQHWPGNSSPEHPWDLAAALQDVLYRLIRQYNPSVIVAPAAIGDHPDHAVIARIMIDFFKQDLFPGTRFLLYQDFPYAVAYNMIDDFLWKTENCFVRVRDHFEDISAQLLLKDILYTVYFSAFAASERQLISHIAQRNKLACADPYLQEAKGLEHFYELISFN